LISCHYYTTTAGKVKADNHGKRPLLHATAFSAFNFGKKRGRKRGFAGRKEAAHGYRNLSAINIQGGFERQITKLKTKYD